MACGKTLAGLLLVLAAPQGASGQGSGPLYDGVYPVESTLDASMAAAPSVAAGVAAFDELSDDDDLVGDFIGGVFGVDPAAYLVDFVYREFCCWEATGISPDWQSCQAQETKHPPGDLRDLYLENFTSWDGAQSRFFGACPGLSFSNEPAQQATQDRVLTLTPGILTSLPQIANDLEQAFANLRLLSRLETSNLGPGESGAVTHTLTHLVADLTDFGGQPSRFSLDLAEAGLTDLSWSGMASSDPGGQLTIPAHAFGVDFGTVLVRLWQLKVLPQNGFLSTADLFSTWVDCAQVGIILADEGGTMVSAETYASAYCEPGIATAAARFEAELATMAASETVLTLSGVATPVEIDGHNRVDGFTGTWNGALSEDMSPLGPANGTFLSRDVVFEDGFETAAAARRLSGNRALVGQ